MRKRWDRADGWGLGVSATPEVCACVVGVVGLCHVHFTQNKTAEKGRPVQAVRWARCPRVGQLRTLLPPAGHTSLSRGL